jgi:putrescine transport system ATP-binding protein
MGDDSLQEFYVSHTATIPTGAHVSVAIRPEKIFMSKETSDPEHNNLKGTVKEIAYQGDISIYHVLLDSGKTVLATQPNLVRLTERPITWNDEVYLHWHDHSAIILTG